MSNAEPEANVSSPETAQEPALTLDDLLNAESEVLRRIGRNQAVERSMAGHYSSTSGHNSGGQHTSHASAKVEHPFEE